MRESAIVAESAGTRYLLERSHTPARVIHTNRTMRRRRRARRLVRTWLSPKTFRTVE